MRVPRRSDFLSLLLLAAALGCQESPPTAESPPSAGELAAALEGQSLTLLAGDESPATDPHDWPAEGEWQVDYIQDDRIGCTRHAEEEVEIDGHKLVRRQSDTLVSLLRFGQRIEALVHSESLETPEGGLLAFRFEMQAGGSRNVTEGVVEGDQLRITSTSLGTTTESSLEWSPEWGGPFAVDDTLKRDPLGPGEVRTFTALVAEFSQPAEFTLTARDYEVTDLLTGRAELLRIEGQAVLDGQDPLEMIFWVDREGQLRKSEVPGLQHASYVVDRATALAEDGAPPQFDLGEMSVVRLDRPLHNPRSSKEIVYRAHLPAGNPAGVFSDCPTQSVRAIDEHTAEITVRALRPQDELPAEAVVVEPTEADLAANSYVQSDDPAVVELAHEFAPDETDPWQLARALESGVRRSMRAQNYSQAFASAAEVAESREGDCTEHAVLLAALCRARGLPARVAVGLVYYPPQQGFAYHMWNEVWIGDRWIPLDATLGQGGIGADHLKLADSDLEGATATSVFLPVMQAMSQLELEVESAE